MDIPALWWSPEHGLIRGGEEPNVRVNYPDAVRLVAAPPSETEVRGENRVDVLAEYIYGRSAMMEQGPRDVCRALLARLDAATPREGETEADQLLADLARVELLGPSGRGYSLRIERYRDDPEDAVYAILKWGMTGTAGIVAWESEAVGRHTTLAGAVHDAVSQAGWEE